MQETRLNNISVTDIAETGQGIGKHEGLVIFIDKAIPGDVVDVQIYRKKRNLAHARIEKLCTSSPYRAEAFCKHFGVCGGCKWQHIDYSTQLDLKQKGVSDALERIAGIETTNCEPILGSAKTQYYRNKLEYTFSNRAWLTDFDKEAEITFPQALGFHIPRQFDKILNIEECFLQGEPSDSIRNAVREFCFEHNYTFYNVKNHTGELRNLIIRTSTTGQVMLAVMFSYCDEARIQKLMQFLKESFSEITSLLYVVNQKKNDTIFDQKIEVYSGVDHIYESMSQLDSAKEPLKFKIGLKSFYQTNSQQAYELYKITAEFANLIGTETVYDLYTGAGTIANFIASKAKKVVGIEYVPTAIEDAILNSKANNISNTQFFAGDMKDILTQKFVTEHGKPDVIITDPPRAGMHADVVQCLLNISAPKIVYVSCNASTQARDISILKEKYDVVRIKPVDMFPHTQHVENVVLLSLRNDHSL